MVEPDPTLQRLRALLLDLIAPAPVVTQADLDALSTADWQLLMTMLRQHRLGPLLHWQLGRARAGLVLPEPIRAELARAYRQGCMRSLGVQRELLRVCRLLDDAGLSSVALKGAYLAFHAYPQPALRPLRDIDVLVRPTQLLVAYQVLMDGGLLRVEAYRGMPEVLAETAKHLPALRAPGAPVHVELHGRLFDPAHGSQPLADPSADPAFWQRRVERPLGDSMLGYESPIDLLLHLIVHAVHDHEFSNGPLLLSDLAFLLAGHAIDWPLFWTLAERAQATRASVLCLQLTQRYWGPQPIAWPATLAPGEVGDGLPYDAALLMLHDSGARVGANLLQQMAQQGSPAARAGLLLRKLFRPRRAMSALYPAAPDSPRILLWYPVHWWRLLSAALPAYWRARRLPQVRDENESRAGLRRWLAGR